MKVVGTKLSYSIILIKHLRVLGKNKFNWFPKKKWNKVNTSTTLQDYENIVLTTIMVRNDIDDIFLLILSARSKTPPILIYFRKKKVFMRIKKNIYFIN